MHTLYSRCLVSNANSCNVVASLTLSYILAHLTYMCSNLPSDILNMAALLPRTASFAGVVAGTPNAVDCR